MQSKEKHKGKKDRKMHQVAFEIQLTYLLAAFELEYTMEMCSLFESEVENASAFDVM